MSTDATSPDPATTLLPRMPRYIVAALHLGYWGLYVLLLIMMVIGTRMGTPPVRALFTTNVGFLLIAPNFLAFYVQYFVLVPRLFPRKRFGLLALFSILTAILSAALCSIVLFSMTPGASPIRSSPVKLVAFISWLSVLALIHMTLGMVIRGFISWYEDIYVKEQLTRKTSQVEAALLRAKLDPHFLFNTLNNIDVLVLRDAPAASKYLNQLSEILRYVLYEARTERVALQSELGYFDKYIALQRIRLPNPKVVSYSLSGETNGLSIAPMLLIPFIENAFKHAAGERDDNAIVVAIAVDRQSLTFVCSNSYQRPATETKGRHAIAISGGLGQELIRQRLNLLYPKRHTLAISDSNNRYSVRLDLTLEQRHV